MGAPASRGWDRRARLSRDPASVRSQAWLSNRRDTAVAVVPCRKIEIATQTTAVQKTVRSSPGRSTPEATTRRRSRRRPRRARRTTRERRAPPAKVRAHEQDPDEDGADQQQQERGEQPAGEAGRGQPRERHDASEQQDDRELGELLDDLRAVVGAPVDLVAEVVAAKVEAADEGGHQSVGGDELGEAVDAEGDRDGRVEPKSLVEEAAVAQAHRPGGRQVAADRTHDYGHADGVEHVGHEPAGDRAGLVPGHENAEQQERRGQPVVEAGLSAQRKTRLALKRLLAGRADADVAGQHRIGRREQGAEQDARPKRQPHGHHSEQGDRRDGQRHHDGEQHGDLSPRAPAQVGLEAEPRGEHGDDERDLTQVLEQGRLGHGVERLRSEQRERCRGDEAEQQVDDRRREGALALMGQSGDAGPQREGEAHEGERERLSEGEAGVDGQGRAGEAQAEEGREGALCKPINVAARRSPFREAAESPGAPASEPRRARASS